MSNQAYGRNQGSYSQYSSNESYPSGKNEEGLRKLLVEQLKDMYWAEKALTKALPKLIKNASSEELKDGIEEHLEVTQEQVMKLEEVFQLLGMKAQAKKCDAMEGLIKEANEILSDMEEGPVRDAGIICAAQKVEHYEIATYGCLATYAELLDEQEAANILNEILEEEKEADEKLSEAANTINWEALEEGDEEDEEEEDEDEEEDDDDDEDEEEEDEEGEDDELSAVESTNASPKISSKSTKSTTKAKS
jgi:ferritin-like metal-binding protein YciE